MPAIARRSNGTILEVDIATVDTEIGLLAGWTPPNATVNNERIKPLNELSSFAVATGGLENETSECELYFDVLDPAHAYLFEICNNVDHADFGTEKTFTATLPIAGTDPWIFTGLVESCAVTLESGSLQKATVTIQVHETTQLPLASA